VGGGTIGPLNISSKSIIKLKKVRDNKLRFGVISSSQSESKLKLDAPEFSFDVSCRSVLLFLGNANLL
jgi:hypothetical protein